MPTRRDQLQAHRFQRRRAVTALVSGRTEPADAPLRRLAAATLSGLLLAAVVTAGCAALRVLRPGAGGAWRTPGAVIVENQTAALYVRLGGVLHPVVNYASAVLAVSTGRPPRVVHVGRRVLDGLPRGAVLGIRQLPVTLPPARELAASPVTVCSRADPGGPVTSVGVGTGLGTDPLAAGDAVVVRAPQDGSRSLVVAGRRHRIDSPQVARSLLLDVAPALAVGSAVLDGVPAGTPLRTPVVPAASAPYRRAVAGHFVAVGRLLHDTDDGRYLLVLADGVADLTALQARLLATVRLPPTRAVAPPLDVSRTDLLDLPQSTTAWRTVQTQLAGLPADLPVVSGTAARRGGLCAVYRGRMSTPILAVPSAATPSGGVTVGGGGAALLRSAGAPDDVAPTYTPTYAPTYLVSAPGRRYAAPSAHVLAGFGYARAAPTTVPARLLALIPTGPALDPATARRPVPA